ncbi:AraC family transcriptional regulator [Halieaceae bacterium IMCC14734]|uniref:AraC family transcriptional regulator n=1 Tax=Candidatus Litorirhabdus singularis TaxID=2518993 RepID=A0ABT3TFV5_9GAMM|nr:AraC family transcriptional regulator [Candidatus Litorirhabdus singularis]MCX2980297.1 AraC family transcriptional regulator [Candidatus Litorirhabdus singularis]
MSAPSKWPLPESGIRFMTPSFMIEKLARHPLTKDCYPTAIGYYPSAAGHRMQRTRHDDNLLMYCVSGQGSLTTDDWQGKIRPGQVLLLPQGLPHQYKADSRDPWTLYWVHFQGASTGIFTQYLGYREGTPVVDAGLSPTLTANFNSLMSVRRTGYSARAFINAANQLRHVFSEMALEISATQANTQHNFNLEQIQDFMREHIDGQLTLEQLAAVAVMSKYHFSSKYKRLTGYPPIKHFLNMKMEYACQLLDSSDLSVNAVAGALGYDDPLYFSRLFSKTIGTSPRSYRASIRR